MKLWPLVLTVVALVVALFGGFYFLRGHPGGARPGVLSTTAWQRMAVPGALSGAHAFLEHNCAACHTAVKGVEASNCIVCHASNASLLQRQPTAFHADVGSCVECHAEHRGVNRRPTAMEHNALTKIGLRQLADADKGGRAPGSGLREQLLHWIKEQERAEHGSASALSFTPEETVLRCETCHANEDRHFTLFGKDCAACHGTAKWTIAEFRHPSPRSLDCAQCHQAPPSHYMEHFRMISMRIAGKPHAQVNQCYLCHQTTAWNDIKGVGWYKHH